MRERLAERMTGRFWTLLRNLCPDLGDLTDHLKTSNADKSYHPSGTCGVLLALSCLSGGAHGSMCPGCSATKLIQPVTSLGARR